ncbi:hypothetical protein D3C80_1465730 [compost metagenome]
MNNVNGIFVATVTTEGSNNVLNFWMENNALQGEAVFQGGGSSGGGGASGSTGGSGIGAGSSSGSSSGITLTSALSFGLTMGEAARQAKMYSRFGSAGYYVEKAIGQGKYIHKGDVYWKGNYPKVTNAMKSSLSAGKLATSIGKGITGVAIVNAFAQYGISEGKNSDAARLAGSLIITGTAFIPVVGPFISIGLGIADSFGAFDSLYNMAD